MTKYTQSDAHVFCAYGGEALHLMCIACGATETVPEYGQGENPTHVLFKPKLPYGWIRMKCHRCGEHSERRLPFSNRNLLGSGCEFYTEFLLTGAAAMPATADHPFHQMFTHKGETASYRVRQGWMTVTWNNSHSGPHEVKRMPELLLAKTMLVQMPAWLKKYPEDGIPAVSAGSTDSLEELD